MRKYSLKGQGDYFNWRPCFQRVFLFVLYLLLHRDMTDQIVDRYSYVKCLQLKESGGPSLISTLQQLDSSGVELLKFIPLNDGDFIRSIEMVKRQG